MNECFWNITQEDASHFIYLLELGGSKIGATGVLQNWSNILVITRIVHQQHYKIGVPIGATTVLQDWS